MPLSSRRLWPLLLAVALSCASAGISAQPAAAFPEKPIRIVVPYGAGGGPDVLARVVGQQLATALKQSVVIDNKPGANGIIAAQAVAKSAPDGDTLLVADTGHLAINPAVYSKLPYDPVADFAPITQAVWTPLFLVVNARLPVHTLAQFLDLARASPGKLSYGSSGNGSPHHLAMELVKSMGRVELTHIPYKGVAESVPALMGGQIDALFAALPSVAAAIEAGQLRAIAVGSVQRSALQPAVPTIAEAGLPGYEMVSRIGFVAPAGTPADRIERLHAAISRALAEPEVARRLPSLGMELIASTPQAYADAIRLDKAKFQKMAGGMGIRIE